jgi:hypothetical protein
LHFCCLAVDTMSYDLSVEAETFHAEWDAALCKKQTHFPADGLSKDLGDVMSSVASVQASEDIDDIDDDDDDDQEEICPGCDGCDPAIEQELEVAAGNTRGQRGRASRGRGSRGRGRTSVAKRGEARPKPGTMASLFKRQSKSSATVEEAVESNLAPKSSAKRRATIVIEGAEEAVEEAAEEAVEEQSTDPYNAPTTPWLPPADAITSDTESLISSLLESTSAAVDSSPLSTAPATSEATPKAKATPKTRRTPANKGKKLDAKQPGTAPTRKRKPSVQVWKTLRRSQSSEDLSVQDQESGAKLVEEENEIVVTNNIIDSGISLSDVPRCQRCGDKLQPDKIVLSGKSKGAWRCSLCNTKGVQLSRNGKFKCLLKSFKDHKLSASDRQ